MKRNGGAPCATKSTRPAARNTLQSGSGTRARTPDKPFVCYLPDKAADSEAHPNIIHARCSVDSLTTPYIARYVAEQIAQIPAEDIARSVDGRYPTVLVVGTGEFVRPVYEYLRERFPNVQLAGASGVELTVLEAYRLLARDPRSRLGWRIALELDPPAGLDDIVTATGICLTRTRLPALSPAKILRPRMRLHSKRQSGAPSGRSARSSLSKRLAASSPMTSRERSIQSALQAYAKSSWGLAVEDGDQAAGLCKRASLVLLELLNREAAASRQATSTTSS